MTATYHKHKMVKKLTNSVKSVSP